MKDETQHERITTYYFDTFLEFYLKMNFANFYELFNELASTSQPHSCTKTLALILTLARTKIRAKKLTKKRVGVGGLVFQNVECQISNLYYIIINELKNELMINKLKFFEITFEFF